MLALGVHRPSLSDRFESDRNRLMVSPADRYKKLADLQFKGEVPDTTTVSALDDAFLPTGRLDVLLVAAGEQRVRDEGWARPGLRARLKRDVRLRVPSTDGRPGRAARSPRSAGRSAPWCNGSVPRDPRVASSVRRARSAAGRLGRERVARATTRRVCRYGASSRSSLVLLLLGRGDRVAGEQLGADRVGHVG